MYGLSNEGKLSVLRDPSSHVKGDIDSVVEDVASSSDLLNGVYLTADCFIQAYPSLTVHLTLQSTGAGSSGNRRHAEFGLTRTILLTSLTLP